MTTTTTETSTTGTPSTQTPSPQTPSPRTAPRLKQRYRDEISAQLREQFGY
jgi:hypothetical protein